MLGGEFGQKLNDGLVKLEQAAVVQDHAGGSGGDDLGDRGQIVDRAGGHGRRCRVISEMPEAFMCDQLFLMSYSDGRAGKGALVDAGTQDGKGTLKLFVLMLERLGQRAVGTLVQKIPSRCFCFRFITHSVHR